MRNQELFLYIQNALILILACGMTTLFFFWTGSHWSFAWLGLLAFIGWID